MSKYYLLDHPQFLQFAFYPQRDLRACPSYATDFFVNVEDDVRVACRFFASDPQFPTVLFFHGNGEIAADYDGIAAYFFKYSRVNLLVAEFRGYGASNGYPMFANVISDAHIILKEALKEISERGCKEELWVMGRSMGSVSALELAKHYPESIKGLIIESGFTCVTCLSDRLGLSLPEMTIKQVEQECLHKVRGITIPALIIHGEMDSLIDVDEAYALEQELGSAKKRLVIVEGADHNSVMAEDITGYFEEIKNFVYD